MARSKHKLRWGQMAAAVLGMLLLGLAAVSALCSGCVSDKLDVVAERVDKVEQTTAAVVARVEQVAVVAAKAGRDVNEPVTGWILAAAVPVCFLGYTLSHRMPGFKWVKNKLRGQ